MRIVSRALPLTLVVLVAGLVACQPAAETAEMEEPSGMAGTEMADAEAAVDDVRADWTAGAEAGDAAAIAALYTEDATYVTPDGQVLEGRESIRQGLSQMLPMMSGLEITSRETLASGDLAVDMGEYASTMTPQGGEGTAADGFYTVVLRRQPDGAWRIVSHMAAQPAPMPGG